MNEEYGSKLLFENFHMLMEKKRVLELVLTDRSAVPSFLEDLKIFKNEFLQKAYIQVRYFCSRLVVNEISDREKLFN